MNNKPNKILRMTRENLSQLTRDDMEKNTKLFFLFRELQDADRYATRANRVLSRAQADALEAEAKRLRLRSAFLEAAAEVSDKIATEPNWLPPFLDKNGDLCVESPFTSRDMRNAARLAHNQMEQQATQSELDPDTLMESDEDEQ